MTTDDFVDDEGAAAGAPTTDEGGHGTHPEGYVVRDDEGDAEGAGEPDRQAAALSDLSHEELQNRALRASQAATRARQQGRREVDELRGEMQRLVAAVEQRLAPAAAAPEEGEGDEAPDRVTDPVGYLEWKLDQGLQPLEDLKKARADAAEQQRKQEELQAQQRAFHARTTEDRGVFLPLLAQEVHGGDAAAAEQDLEAATSWLYDQRFNELAAVHPTATAEQIHEAILTADVFGPNGLWADPQANRVAVVYEAALSRGWSPRAGSAPAAAPGTSNGGATPVLRPPPTEARRQVSAAAQRRQGNVNMPGAEGASPGGSPKLAQILATPGLFDKERKKFGSLTDMLQHYGKLE